VIRKVFKMPVHPDQHAEYARRHNPIWRELEEMLVAHGERNYSIFLDERTSELWAFVAIEWEERWNAMARVEVCQR
jgi:L-rhamnose mutarotase